MMKITSRFLIPTILLFGLITIFSNCKDPVMGCTDPEAENYNADAEEDDDSCVYARDKFLGDYVGDMDCPAPLPDAEDFTMVIRESLNGSNDVEIEFVGTATPLPILLGTADGNMITVPEGTYEVALNPDFPDVKTEIQMSLDATMNETETEITATVNVTLSGITLSCDVVAVKQ